MCPLWLTHPRSGPQIQKRNITVRWQSPLLSKSATVAASNQPAGNNTAAMCMVATLFFMWGFVTCLNDILIPHLKAIFDLSYFQVMLVQFAFFHRLLYLCPASR